MYHTFKLLILLFILSIFQKNMYAQENDTIQPKDHIEKINAFIKKLRKKTPTSMYDYFTFFGENNELEIKYVREHCKEDSISFSDCIEISKKLYSSPFKYKSLALKVVEENKFGKYIQKLHPEDSVQVVQDTINDLPSSYIINVVDKHYFIKMNLLKKDGNYILDILNYKNNTIFTF